MIGRADNSWIPDHLARTGSVVPNEALWHPNLRVLEVTTPFAFTQMCGYLRFSRRSQGEIYYRGQSAMHRGLVPSLLRNTDGGKKRNQCLQKAARTRIQELKSFLASSGAAFLNGTPDYPREALLQHYFLRTRWVDILDNPWVALWFACHSPVVRHSRYVTYVPRVPLDTPAPSRSEGDDLSSSTTVGLMFGYAFVLLLQPGPFACVPASPGLYHCGKKFQLIDLRIASPSLYLRPHSNCPGKCTPDSRRVSARRLARVRDLAGAPPSPAGRRRTLESRDGGARHRAVDGVDQASNCKRATSSARSRRAAAIFASWSAADRHPLGVSSCIRSGSVSCTRLITSRR